MSVALTGVYKTYVRGRRREEQEIVGLDGVDLDVAGGELLVVVGPSGSGKTTMLRCIAGLETIDEGRIAIGGRDVTTKPAGSRDVAMVFQDFALYPHLTVEANISFGLRAHRQKRATAARKVSEVAALLGLDDILHSRPGELSGGERQRVALARAIVREPRAFLMDEPLSNLDAELRAYSRVEIRALVRRLGTTTVYVTHDQVEALTMGDRVAVLRAGHIEQVDAPVTLYQRPANAFVARFLGSPPMNLFPARLHGTTFGSLTLGLRPERIHLTDPERGVMTGRVNAVEPIGGEGIVHVEVDGHRLLVRARWEEMPSPGRDVGLAFNDEDLHLFDGPEGRAVR